MTIYYLSPSAKLALKNKQWNTMLQGTSVYNPMDCMLPYSNEEDGIVIPFSELIQREFMFARDIARSNISGVSDPSYNGNLICDLGDHLIARACVERIEYAGRHDEKGCRIDCVIVDTKMKQIVGRFAEPWRDPSDKPFVDCRYFF